MRLAPIYDDRYSIKSSVSSYSAPDTVSQRSAGSQLRRFTASVGKPGQAREAREAIKALVTSVNPIRKPPLAQPIDYESFVTDKQEELDSDSQRDLLLFPGDDFGEISEVASEQDAVTADYQQQEPTWLLTQEGIKMFAAPTKSIEFHYAGFSGDYDTRSEALFGDLTPLSFEADLTLEEERAALEGNVFLTSDIICEGYLFVVPESSSDSFKNVKKRYCLFRKHSDGRVVLEIRKSPSIAPNQPVITVKQVLLSKNRKGRSLLEVVSAADGEKNICFAADVDSDMSRWLFEVDRALACRRGSTAAEETASFSSIGLPSVADTSAEDIESLHSAEETSVSLKTDEVQEPNSGIEESVEEGVSTVEATETVENTETEVTSLKEEEDNVEDVKETISDVEDDGKEEVMEEASESMERPVDDENAQKVEEREEEQVDKDDKNHVKALLPPIVERHNVFTLYIDLDPLPNPKGEPCSLLQGQERTKTEPRSDKHVVKFTVEFQRLGLKLPAAAQVDRVEPLFVRLFLFDARAGKRISEEFRVSPRFGESDLADDNGGDDSKSSIGEESFGIISYSVLSDPNANKMICSVAQPHRDIYVVARIERILSPDHSGEIYTKTNADAKTLGKLIKNVQAAAAKLSKFRMPFAWAARPTFQEMLGGSAKIQEDNPLYRWDGNKMADSDLQKVLNDLAKSEKSGKTSIIPGASISLSVDISAKINEFPMRISPSYTPIQPWIHTPETSPCFEMQPFSDSINEPYTSLINNLYVYPLLLKYDGQKVFTKARNIACTVQFVASPERNGNSKAIYDRFAHPIPFVHKIRCTVQHHEQSPAFADEIKIQLPLGLDPLDHLLFSFSHIAVSAAVQKPNEPFEIPVGYSWLPLVKNDRLVMENDEQEVALPVAADLPDGYITYQSLGLGKGHIGPEVRWVEGGKPLFRVRLRLVSSVFTTEARLQSFFQGCQKLQAIGLSVVPQATSPPSDDTDSLNHSSQQGLDDFEFEKFSRYVAKKAQALLEVEIERLIPFLPIILSRLLSLLPNCTTDEMAITVLTTLIGIVDRAVVAGRSALLNNYVKNQLHSNGMKVGAEQSEETTHSSICKYASILVMNAKDDIGALAAIFRQLGFLLDVAAKSMAQRLMDTELYKEPRRNRFSAELCARIRNFIEQVVPLLVMKHREIPVETRLANSAIAYFLRCSLSFLDRGSVFSWIHYTVTKFDEADSRLLREYKLDLLQILAGHEHWLPLALPLLCDSTGAVIKLDETASNNYTDFGGVAATGGSFLVDVFLKSFVSSNAEESLVNSNPYLHFMDEFTLTEGYCTRHFLTGLLLQELQCSFREPREYRRRAIALVRNVLAKHSIDKRYGELRCQTRIATLYIPLLRIVLDNLGELDPSLTNIENSMQSPTGSQMGLLSSGNARSRRPGSADRFSIPRVSSGGSEMVKGTVASPVHHSGVEQGQFGKSSGNLGAGQGSSLSEKLDWFESRDLLLSAIYILYRMPRKIFEALLMDSESSGGGLIDFVRLLELVLEFFKYRGLKFTLSRTSGKIRFTKRSMHVNASPVSTSNVAQPSNTNGTSENQPSAAVPAAPVIDLEEDETLPFSVLQETNLTQEVALTVLELNEILGEFMDFQNKTTGEDDDQCFVKLLRLKVTLLNESWPDVVRKHTMASIAIFFKQFNKRFLKTGPLEALSVLIEALLLQLNSRMISIQTAAASLLHIILRSGYEDYIHSEQNGQNVGNFSDAISITSGGGTQHSIVYSTECLGRPGSQTGVALARVLGQNASLAGSHRFERGLTILESYLAHPNSPHCTAFDIAVTELIVQLRGVLAATGALAAAVNNPIRVADLHIQLADSYRGSAALRSAWFDTLAETHIHDRWYPEAAICEMHVLAIMAKELSSNGVATFDWNLFSAGNDCIALEEDVYGDERNVEKAGFTIRNFTAKVEKTIQTLVLAERYEAIGPICRLAIPLYEKMKDFRALVSMYVELQQAYSLADQVKITGKRHLGAYFRVFFFSPTFFGDEHKTEWIYREPGLTSLAEAYERMTKACRLALGHEKVQVIPEKEIDEEKLDKDCAYIQMTHVEPAVEDGDKTSFEAHTNLRRFMYESNDVDTTVPEDAPNLARQALKKVYLTTMSPFPNTCRRQRVGSREEEFMNPLELAVDKLTFKADQISKILESASASDGTKKSLLARLDVKGLQLLLQGAVQPTVNVGPLAYAEAFTAPAQKERYGDEGVMRLAMAFKKLMTVCADALQINEAAISSDQAEYQQMLKDGYVAMIERLNGYFGDLIPVSNSKQEVDSPTNRKSLMFLNAIGGLKE